MIADKSHRLTRAATTFISDRHTSLISTTSQPLRATVAVRPRTATMSVVATLGPCRIEGRELDDVLPVLQRYDGVHGMVLQVGRYKDATARK
jgi:hypothetical protein